ncbi:unnamed protein product [Cladocopium goreaui]|uniref:Two pore calcium channel protein 1B (Voltage-dependent calcium channel protein TPC1B) (NtTPC1B) n=1 Tax=Cladocopium goreaui TaxID=2562237 RepID=A0A9P1GLJ5_9DINO|nr:unnamed protein product [Cladocopium goreaui]
MGVSRMGVWSWRRNSLVVPLPECLAMRAKMSRRVLEKRGFYVAPDLGNQEVEDLAKRVKAANDGLSLAFGEWQKKKKVNVTEIGHLQLAKVNGRLEKVNLPRFANEAALSLYRKDFKRRCRERAQSSQSGAVLTKGFFRQWVSGNPAELLACYIIGRFAAAPQPGSFQVCGGDLRPEVLAKFLQKMTEPVTICCPDQVRAEKFRSKHDVEGASVEAVRIASVAPDDNRAAKLHPTFGASIARDCAVVGSAVAWAGSDGEHDRALLGSEVELGYSSELTQELLRSPRSKSPVAEEKKIKTSRKRPGKVRRAQLHNAEKSLEGEFEKDQGIFMSMGALLLGNMLQEYVIDDTFSREDREWIWRRYGTTFQAMYTLFEITFAGNWPTSARPVMEKVSPYFVLFFIPYICIVVFAIIRVIGAVFLKDTLDAAQNDAEQLVIDRLRLKEQYVNKLEGIFRAIDETGNGLISEERLSSILSNPKVAAYFQTLDLDVHKSAALFHILDNGDGEVTLDEFIDGIMRCKGPARAIDQVAMHAELKQLDAKVTKLFRKLLKVSKASHFEIKTRNASKQVTAMKVFRGELGLGSPGRALSKSMGSMTFPRSGRSSYKATQEDGQ